MLTTRREETIIEPIDLNHQRNPRGSVRDWIKENIFRNDDRRSEQQW